MKVKSGRDVSSPYAAMLAVQDMAARCKEHGINALHIKIRGAGGTHHLVQSLQQKSRSFHLEVNIRYERRLRKRDAGPWWSGRAAFPDCADINIGRIEDITPIPSDTPRWKGGRHGRRN